MRDGSMLALQCASMWQLWDRLFKKIFVTKVFRCYWLRGTRVLYAVVGWALREVGVGRGGELELCVFRPRHQL